MKRILIAEDERHFRRALLEALYKEGYLAFAVENGLRAWENLKAYRPHLLILDLKMPKIDGIELLRRIRTERYTIPIIIVTAYRELARDLELQKSENIIAVMSKPVDMIVLKNKINEILENVR